MNLRTLLASGRTSSFLAALVSLLGLAIVSGIGCKTREAQNAKSDVQLSHEKTLDWIREHRAWRLAKKAKPIWGREITRDEVGKEFQTVDHITEQAKPGYLLCVGVAGEPWFQNAERIAAKFHRLREEEKQFSFDPVPRKYQLYQPNDDVQTWAAQISDPGIKGFYIKPSYDPQKPLYSPVGGYVVMDYVPNPYEDQPKDIWLVQQALFESTYEWVR